MREFRVRLFPNENEKPLAESTIGIFGDYFPTILLIIGAIAFFLSYIYKFAAGYVIAVICLGLRYFLVKGKLSASDNKTYKPQLRKSASLDLKIGRSTEYDYNCIDVYYQGLLIGEIRKSGIDEIIEKGALAGAKYSGFIHDVPQITIRCLEHHEYMDKPEYKAWREKIKNEP